MGWWWGSPQSTNTDSQAVNNPNVPQLPKNGEDNLPVTSSKAQDLSREEKANLEWAELLKELQEQASTEKDERLKSTQSGTFLQSNPVVNDISPDSLYPTELSCRSAFDYAMFCQSLGGQFVNVYRFGSYRSCSNHWEDFWLCMRTRNWDKKDREQAVRDHYRKKAVKYKTGPSSEDVWTVRTEPVKDAFQENLEVLESRIAEWKKANPHVPDPWSGNQGTTFGSQGSK